MRDSIDYFIVFQSTKTICFQIPFFLNVDEWGIVKEKDSLYLNGENRKLIITKKTTNKIVNLGDKMFGYYKKILYEYML